jgi:hypothetical protein
MSARALQLSPRARRMRRDLIALSVIHLLLYLVLFTPWQAEGYDDVFYYSYISSPFFDGDLDITNDLYSSNNEYLPIRNKLFHLNAKGYPVNMFAPGTALLEMPWLLAVRIPALIANALLPNAGLKVDDRFWSVYRTGISVGTVVYGLIAILLVYRICRFRFSAGVSFHAALAVTAAGPLLSYIFRHPAMSHTPSALASSLMVFLALRYRHFRSMRAYVLVAAGLGFVTLVRWQDAVFGLIPAAFFVRMLLNSRRRPPVGQAFGRAAVASLVYLVIVSIQPCYWKAYFGEWLLIPQGPKFMHWSEPRILETLFSGWSGLYYWHPVLLVATIGVVVWAAVARSRWLPIAAILAFSINVYVNSVASDWFAGASFGSRRFGNSVAVLALGMGTIYSMIPHRARARALPVITTVLVLVNMVLLVGYSRGLFRPFYMTELAPIAGYLVGFVPRFIAMLPVEYGTVTYSVLFEPMPMVWVFAPIAVALILAVPWLVLPAWRFISAHWRGFTVAAVVFAVAVDAYLLANSLPPSEEGIRFGRMSPNMHENPQVDLEELHRIAETWGNSPAALVLLAERTFDADELTSIVERIGSYSRKFRARAVFALHHPEVHAQLMPEAEKEIGYRPSSGTSALRAWAVATPDARRGARRARRVLTANPTDVDSLQLMIAAERGRGRKERAERIERQYRRILEVRLATYEKKKAEFPGWEQKFYRDFYQYSADALKRLNTQERQQ